MTGILAITPSCTGSKIHLELAGYQPGAKPRSGTDGSMCGAFVHRGQVRVPLTDARDWPGHSCPCACARGANRNWCRACLGHAAAVHGIANQVVTLILEAVP